MAAPGEGTTDGGRSGGPGREKGYFHGHDDSHASNLAGRAADAAQGRFFLPYLTAGMRILDCGCGPGSITLGFAEAVGPEGEAVGVDLSPRFIERATELAAEKGVENASFRQGDVYALPFEDASFDAVFAHTLLVHLGDPLAAVKEMVRVARPGGVIGLRDADWGSLIWAPHDPLVQKYAELSVKGLEELGASPRYARGQRHLLIEAGCERAESAAVAISAGNPQAFGFMGPRLAGQLHQPGFQEMVKQGIIDSEEIAEIEAALKAWTQRPDAFFALLFCESVARLPS